MAVGAVHHKLIDAGLRCDTNLIIDLKEYPVINQLILVGEQSSKYKKEIND